MDENINKKVEQIEDIYNWFLRPLIRSILGFSWHFLYAITIFFQVIIIIIIGIFRAAVLGKQLNTLW